MSSNKRLYIVLALVAIVIGLLIFLFFEYRMVNNADWANKYELHSKDPQGTWLMEELTKSYFPEATNEENSIPEDIPGEHQLYIRMARRASLLQAQIDSLAAFVDAGNTAIVIAENMFGNIDTLLGDDFYVSYFWYSSSYITFDFWEGSPFDSMCVYYAYNNELDTTDLRSPLYSINANTSSDSTDYKPVFAYLSTVYDDGEGEPEEQSDGMMARIPRGENDGLLYIGTIPEIFTNIGLQQRKVVQFYDEFLHRLREPSHIYWDMRPGLYIKELEDRSPLRFIMAQPSLRLGYFMLMGLSLLFLIFRSRRRQKVFPLREENTNTSLEYIDTLSKLYLSAEKHEKLVLHHEKIFYHEVEKKYFIRKDHPDFVGALAKKSRSTEEEIQTLQSRFDQARKGEAFSIYQLKKVTDRINSILNPQ